MSTSAEIKQFKAIINKLETLDSELTEYNNLVDSFQKQQTSSNLLTRSFVDFLNDQSNATTGFTKTLLQLTQLIKTKGDLLGKDLLQDQFLLKIDYMHALCQVYSARSVDATHSIKFAIENSFRALIRKYQDYKIVFQLSEQLVGICSQVYDVLIKEFLAIKRIDLVKKILSEHFDNIDAQLFITNLSDNQKLMELQPFLQRFIADSQNKLKQSLIKRKLAESLQFQLQLQKMRIEKDNHLHLQDGFMYICSFCKNVINITEDFCVELQRDTFQRLYPNEMLHTDCYKNKTIQNEEKLKKLMMRGFVQQITQFQCAYSSMLQLCFNHSCYLELIENL